MSTPKIDFREVRRMAGWSQIRAAVFADVGLATVRLYEKGGPQAVADRRKRASLDDVYGSLRRAVRAPAVTRQSARP
jgi:DNA-binding XRE family transcriptional regulator